MTLLYEKKDRIVTITFNRPEVLNAMDVKTNQEFSDALISFRDDPEAWVGIITGTGDRAFSAGHDLKEGFDRSQIYELPPMLTRGLDVWNPLIAAINGLALGEGLEVALACDLRIAAENATFGTPEVRWSVMPGQGGTQRLPRMLPQAKAAELVLMGTPLDANEAYHFGLVNKVVPLSELMTTAWEWATKICQNGPLGVRTAKEAMIRGLSMSLEDGLQLERLLLNKLFTIATEDIAEGQSAFREKRKPQFKVR